MMKFQVLDDLSGTAEHKYKTAEYGPARCIWRKTHTVCRSENQQQIKDKQIPLIPFEFAEIKQQQHDNYSHDATDRMKNIGRLNKDIPQK